MAGGPLVQRVLSLASVSPLGLNAFTHQTELPSPGSSNAPDLNTLVSTAVVDVSRSMGETHYYSPK